MMFQTSSCQQSKVCPQSRIESVNSSGITWLATVDVVDSELIVVSTKSKSGLNDFNSCYKKRNEAFPRFIDQFSLVCDLQK